jgi:hypothetical protein
MNPLGSLPGELPPRPGSRGDRTVEFGRGVLRIQGPRARRESYLESQAFGLGLI